MIWGGVEERKPDHLIPASAKNIHLSDQEDRKYKFKIIEIRVFCDNVIFWWCLIFLILLNEMMIDVDRFSDKIIIYLYIFAFCDIKSKILFIV